MKASVNKEETNIWYTNGHDLENKIMDDVENIQIITKKDRLRYEKGGDKSNSEANLHHSYRCPGNSLFMC